MARVASMLLRRTAKAMYARQQKCGSVYSLKARLLVPCQLWLVQRQGATIHVLFPRMGSYTRVAAPIPGNVATRPIKVPLTALVMVPTSTCGKLISARFVDVVC